jgi:hypothetical protein
MKDYKDLSPRVKGILYDLAVEFGFNRYSTPEELDYKFWEDTPSEWIAIALAEKLEKLENETRKPNFEG